MPDTVTIACMAPHGLVIGRNEFGEPIVLAGPPPQSANPGNILGVGFTDIDSAVWDAWAACAGASFVAGGTVWQDT